MLKDYIGILIVGIVISIVTILGFSIVGSPAEKRLVTLDTARLQDFSSIKSAVESYYAKKKVLPTDLKTIFQDRTLGYSELQITDPETKSPYEYKVTTVKTYKLCATFSTNSEVLKVKTDNPYVLTTYDDGAQRNLEFKKGFNCMDYTLPSSLTSTPTPSYDEEAKSALVDESTCKDSGGTWNKSECVMNYCKDEDKTVTSSDNSFFTSSGIGFGTSSETNSAMSDRCFNGYVMELLCKKKGKLSVPQYMNYYCPNGCKDGACVK